MTAPPDASRPVTVHRFRAVVAAILAAGLLGTGLELLLMSHLEDWWQRIPLVLIGAALLTLAWQWRAKSRGSVVALRLVMLLFLLSAGLGIVLHAKGNREFALERTPGLPGREMVAEMATGAFPALAPGTMALLGLLGLLLTWRHPSLGYPE